MSTKRNQRGRKTRISLVTRLRRTISRHCNKHLVIYVPALAPLAFFFLAHGITLVALVLIKSGVLPQGQVLHKTLVTWAVYGILPLLLCSYGCFFAVARPVTGLLVRKFPEWTPIRLTLAAGAAYGAAIGIALVVLLEPRSLLRVFFLLIIGVATGLGNWLLYRKLTVTVVAADEPTVSR